MRSFCAAAMLIVTTWCVTGCDSKSGADAKDGAASASHAAAPDPLANVGPRNVEPKNLARPSLDSVIANDAQPAASAPDTGSKPASSAALSQQAGDADLAARHQAVIERTVLAIELNTAVLRTIVDERSALAATANLKAARRKLDEAGQQANALGPVPRQQNALLTTPLGQRVIEATNAMTAELQRISDNPTLNAAVQRAMQAGQ